MQKKELAELQAPFSYSFFLLVCYAFNGEVGG
jgi:hypothetical protein